jgi:hypothetical protein
MEEMDESVSRMLDELADDPTAIASRLAVCQAVAAALSRVGHVFWLTGYLVGPDRKSGVSRFKFGNDGAVGLATVAQIGGELAKGAVQLLQAENLYAASALTRQLVEVEYLVKAFESENEVAAEWLRADREARRVFWSPERLRCRAGGAFLRTDYWHHCDRGGHPAREGMSLLPSHARMNSGYLWVDLAGHLRSIWISFAIGAERLLGGPFSDDWKLPDVAAAIDHWISVDRLYAALGDLSRMLRADAENA